MVQDENKLPLFVHSVDERGGRGGCDGGSTGSLMDGSSEPEGW